MPSWKLRPSAKFNTQGSALVDVSGRKLENVGSTVRGCWVRLSCTRTPNRTPAETSSEHRSARKAMLRHKLVDNFGTWNANGRPKCYKYTLSFMLDRLASGDWSPSSHALEILSEIMSFDQDIVRGPANSYQYRDDLMQIASTFGSEDQALIGDALDRDEAEIYERLWDISASNADEVLQLDGRDAENFMNLMLTVLDKYPSQILGRNDEQFRCNARQLLVRLAQTCSILPSSIFINGIKLLDQDTSFEGGFAQIFRATYGGKIVALKRLRTTPGPRGQPESRMLCREVLVWKQLRHPFILPFLGVECEIFKPKGFASASRELCKTQGHMCLVSPWLKQGSVLDYMKSISGEDITADRLASEIAQGMEYIHSLSIVHGDLRCCNILVDDECHARIADFGLAFILPTTVSHSKDVRGSLRWMAPELHQPHEFGLVGFQRTTETDVFAFACTLLELYTRKPPFHYIANEFTVALEYMRGERPKRPGRPPLSNYVWGLMQSCWSQQPADRPSMKAVAGHLRNH